MVLNLRMGRNTEDARKGDAGNKQDLYTEKQEHRYVKGMEGYKVRGR